MEHEELVLQKLKIEVGAQEVKKMVQMIKDIQLSKDTQLEFNNSIGENQINGVEFEIEVLTNGTWPAMPDPPVRLPVELQACMERFTMWYKNANSSRQLTWLFTNG